MRAAIKNPGREGRPTRRGITCATLLIWALTGPAIGADATAPVALAALGPRTLIVLDPVDLATNLPDPAAGRLLRRGLADNPAWRVTSGDSLAKQLHDLGMDPDLPCAEFQCAFDAGNALQTEFVLFGTATNLPGLNAYTLDLAHIPTSQVVWSRVGQASKRSPAGRRMGRSQILEGPLQFAVAGLDPAGLNLRKQPSMGLLGVMDGGQSTPHSRVIMHRALSHAYAARSYDMLGPAEMEGLLAALDLNPVHGNGAGDSGALAAGTGMSGSRGMGGSGPGSADPAANMLALGKSMGVRYLLRTEAKNEGREYSMDLSLYDVAAGKMIRHWPARATGDYPALLGMEDRFMTALGEEGPVPQAAKAHHPWRSLGKGASISLAAIGGAALGWMPWQSKEQADQEYARFKSSQTRDQAADARGRVVADDTQARKYCLLGGLSLAVGVAIWTF